MPHFDNSITLGTIVTLIVFAAGAIQGWVVLARNRAIAEASMAVLIEGQRVVLSSLTERFHEHELRDDALFRTMQGQISEVSGLLRAVTGDLGRFRESRE